MNDFQKKYKLAQKIADSIGANNSIWSIYEELENIDEIPFPEATHVVYTDHWGGNVEEGEPVNVWIEGNGSWKDLWKAADTAIKESGDSHHTFIEVFKETSDPNVVSLHTRS
jgi:hypothetical protein